MTTKTTILLSPIKRSSPKLKKRRMIKYSTTIPKMISSTTMITKKQNLPDLVNDLFIEQQQQRETIITIARILRKVGDQMDEQLQVRIFSSKNNFLIFFINLD
jgi:hypothetical protein